MWELIFKKNEKFQEAKEALARSKMLAKSVEVDFPNVDAKDLTIKKNKWLLLDSSFADRVQTMGMSVSENYVSTIVHYEAKSEGELDVSRVFKHKHNSLFEFMFVLEGAIVDRSTGMKYWKGENHKVNKGTPHYICRHGDGEVYLFIVLSSEEVLVAPPRHFPKYNK